MAAQKVPAYDRESMTERELASAVEIFPRRLYWKEADFKPADSLDIHYFSTDEELIYEPFAQDFGPLNLSMVYRYCNLLKSKMQDPALAGKRIVHVCSSKSQHRANTAFLICAYQIIVWGRTAKKAYQPFENIEQPFKPFRDALSGASNFDLFIEDCLDGLCKAIELGWFDLKTFDVDAYEHYGRVTTCDATWLIPNKLMAFAGPSPTARDVYGFPTFTPDDCATVFKELGIGLVIRLNRKQYDRSRFIERGIKHVDLYFVDGSCPPKNISSTFLQIVEEEPGPVAIHCKAGLGRTGTLIGMYAMKHYHFPARAFIGWSRICRPGCVLGHQQQFLVNIQEEMFAAGSLPPTLQALTLNDDRTAEEQQEDVGQGERLCSQKMRGAVKAGAVSADAVAPAGTQPAVSTAAAAAPITAADWGVRAGCTTYFPSNIKLQAPTPELAGKPRPQETLPWPMPSMFQGNASPPQTFIRHINGGMTVSPPRF